MRDDVRGTTRLMRVRRIGAAAALLGAALFVFYSVTRIPVLTHDFGAYYKFSRTLMEGRSVGALYDSTALNDPAHSYGITAIDRSYNPPTSALALLPVAPLDAMPARIAWSVLSIACFLTALVLLLRANQLNWKSAAGIWSITLALAWHPAYVNIALGQLYMVLLVLFALSMLGVIRNNRLLTAAPISLMILFKGYGLVLLVWLVVAKRWREAALACGIVVVAIALLLPWITIADWLLYYEKVFVVLGRLPSDASVAYQAINNFMRHFLLFDAQWSPQPLFVIPEPVVHAVSLAISLIVVVATLVVLSPRRVGLIASYAAALAVSVITSPLSFEYHYILYLPLIVAIVASLIHGLQSDTVGVREWIAFALLLVMAIPLPYQTLQAAPFPLEILAFPKLGAGIGLLVLARGVLGRNTATIVHA